jgi:hypothetical protein
VQRIVKGAWAMGDPAEKAIEKIVKQLPVKQIYEDGLSGATKQVGHSLTMWSNPYAWRYFHFSSLQRSKTEWRSL